MKDNRRLYVATAQIQGNFATVGANESKLLEFAKWLKI